MGKLATSGRGYSFAGRTGRSSECGTGATDKIAWRRAYRAWLERRGLKEHDHDRFQITPRTTR